MTVWKCSAENCGKDAEVIAAGTSLCKEHGAQVAGVLNALLMLTYQKETMLGMEEEERKTMERMAMEEEQKKKQRMEEERKLVQSKRETANPGKDGDRK